MSITAIWKGRKRRDAYRTIFDTPQGQEVLDDLYKFCCGGKITYSLGDSHHTAFSEGARSVWLHIQRKRLANEANYEVAERLEAERLQQLGDEQ